MMECKEETKMRRLAKLAIALLPVLLLSSARANVIHVPAEQPTIQIGLDSAQAGDNVLVAPGRYKERITWPSRDGIKLLSELGPDSTVINADSGDCGLTLSSGQTRATVIQGFLVTGSLIAGICCQSASPSILNNRLARCGQHGLYLISADHVLARGNEVCGCVQDSVQDYQYGAGIYVSGSSRSAHPEVCYNYVHHDSLGGAYYSMGAGIYCSGSGLIYQNWVDSNYIRGYSGLGYGYGGGICLEGSGAQPLVFDNLVTDNKVDAWYKFGGGIYVSSVPSLVFNNTVVGNICTSGGYPEGGGLYNEYCTTAVWNNIIAQNTAGSGSGVYNADYGSSALVSGHNDFFGNTLYNCAMGPGDISLDPLFASGVHGGFYLSQTAAGQAANSPCLDAGDTLLSTLPLNLDSLLQTWTTRTDSVPDSGVLDIGYHYSLVNYPTAMRESRIPRARIPNLLAVWPNPCRSVALFQSPVPGRVTVFDAAGRKLAEFELTGREPKSWIPGKLQAGTCFCRLSFGIGTSWARLLIVR
jgi:hypothetical protein